MSYSLVVYTNPLDAEVVFTSDHDARVVEGAPYTHESGRQGQVCYVSDEMIDEVGATLELARQGYHPMRVRGFLRIREEDKVARLEVDDFTLTQADATPPPTQPPPTGGNKSPEQIIMDVFNATQPDLTSKSGCGQFTEDCCTALHEQDGLAWGHVTKNPGQNQWNGHAVDAVHLLKTTAGTQSGIYDIIFSSESHEAKPVFNYAGPPDPEIWHYPAGAYRIGPNGTLMFIGKDGIRDFFGEGLDPF